MSKTDQLRIKDLAAAMGITKQSAWAWIQKGMPRTSIEDAVAWRASHGIQTGVSGRGRRSRAPVPKGQPEAAAAPISPPPEELARVPAGAPAHATPSEHDLALARAAQAERDAYDTWQQAVALAKGGDAVQAGLLPSLHAAFVRSQQGWLLLQKRHQELASAARLLVSVDEAKSMVTRGMMTILGALDGMDARVAPGDPAMRERIRAEIARARTAAAKVLG